MVTDNFRSAQELFIHVLPVLKSKTKEFKLQNLPFISEKVIWKCLRETKWKKESELTLFDVVSDIFHLTDNEVLTYLKEKNRE